MPLSTPSSCSSESYLFCWRPSSPAHLTRLKLSREQGLAKTPPPPSP
jgi:hypothetical protein